MSASLLIIEDDEPLRRALKDRFQQEGYDVRTAIDGQEGLSSAITNHPDVIILDLFIPKIPGENVIRDLRIDPWGKTAVVFILSNLHSQELEEEMRKYNCAAYMVKAAWKLEDIVRKIKEACPPHPKP